MFQTLRDVFTALKGEPPKGGPAAGPGALRLACAVLLVEVMRADPQITDAERDVVMEAMRRRFPLGERELHELVVLADEASRSASDFHQFTSRLNAELDQPSKVAVVETMWQVAYADGAVDAHENHVISRIAGLLHVTHGEYIAAKLRARQAAGL